MNKAERLEALQRLAFRNSYHIRDLLLYGDYPPLQSVINLEKYERSDEDLLSFEEIERIDPRLLDTYVPGSYIYEPQNWYPRLKRDAKLGKYVYTYSV